MSALTLWTGRGVSATALVLLAALLSAAPAPAVDGAPAKAKGGRLDLRFVAANGGAAVAGAEIFYQVRAGGPTRSGTLTTDADGKAAVEWPDAGEVKRLNFTASKPGFAPVHVDWNDRTRPVVLPASKEVRLDDGLTAGGVVVDAAGRPVAGARVEILAPVTESDVANFLFHVAVLETDAEGRWRTDEAPATPHGLSIRVSREGFRPSSDLARPRPDFRVVLTRGLTVTGRVVDNRGRAVKGAKAVLSLDTRGSRPPRGTTDDLGAFRLENCEPGGSVVTVQADGHGPGLVQVVVADDMPAVEVRLGLPSTVRGRVVDRDGKAVAGASVSADTWRGARTLDFRTTSGADGRFVWDGAPDDDVVFALTKPGFQSLRDARLTPGGAEQVVTLAPELVVSGEVSNLANGLPVRAFRVTHGLKHDGLPQPLWDPARPAAFTDGTFRIKPGVAKAGHAFRVEADGYKPVVTRAVASDEGAVTLNVAMEPTGDLTGLVLLPGGKPAAGVQVTVCGQGGVVGLLDGRFPRGGDMKSWTTGADGRFVLPALNPPYFLVAAGDGGYTEANSEEFGRSDVLVLEAWGVIHGRVWKGGRPAPGEPVRYTPNRANREGVFLNHSYQATADADGRFRFDRVVPGPGILMRAVVTKTGDRGERHIFGWQKAVEVDAGGEVEADLGGKGRPVVGRLVVEGDPEVVPDWPTNPPVSLRAPPARLAPGQATLGTFPSVLDKDGRFRVEDVPPGRYNLNATLTLTAALAAEVRRTTVAVDVPDGPADEPIDVGDVKIVLAPPLKVGDDAPTLAGTLVRGGRFRPDHIQGKLLLVHFYSSVLTPTGEESRTIPPLKRVNETFGKDPRFAMVGVDAWPSRAGSEQFAERQGLRWELILTTSISAGLARAFNVRALPMAFLISPDGKILARLPKEDEIEGAVREALKGIKRPE